MAFSATMVFGEIELYKNSKTYFSLKTNVELFNEVIEYCKQYDKKFYDVLTEDKKYTLNVLNIERNIPRPRMDIGCYQDVRKETAYMFDELFYDTVSYPEKDYDYSILDEYLKVLNLDQDKDEWFSSVKELATKVINTLSQTINNYQEWSVESAGREWDFSKFFEFPFIMDLKGNYISVSDITLRNAFFEKLFWLIRNCYSQIDSRAIAFFGRLFEKYIQDLSYNAVKNDYTYIAEFSYIRNGANLLVTEAKGFQF
jgi:hypothetical protein